MNTPRHDNTAGIRASAQRRKTDAERRTRDAIRALNREHKPITFRSVAERAGVSEGYLRRGPFASQIKAQHTPGLQTAQVSEPPPGEPTIVAALRHKIRTLEAQHGATIAALRAEQKVRDATIADLTGRIIALNSRYGE